MIVIIGADGFLGKCVAAKLREMPWEGKSLMPFHDREMFFDFLPVHYQEVDWIIYCDKREKVEKHNTFRMEYVRQLWSVSASYSVPLVYAFFQPDKDVFTDFQPEVFATWTRKQYRKPPYWYIFRLSELYGPNDGGPSEQMSHVLQWYQTIVETGRVELMKKRDSDDDTGFCRDYVYVKDVVRALYWFMTHQPASDVYDIGSGFARTDMAVVHAIYQAMRSEPRIEFCGEEHKSTSSVDSVFMPNLSKLRRIGYKKDFMTVEKGVKSYVQRYLQTGNKYL
jgi:ADP-L-glycero-D-manno-heptose 6-epimerase